MGSIKDDQRFNQTIRSKRTTVFIIVGKSVIDSRDGQIRNMLNDQQRDRLIIRYNCFQFAVLPIVCTTLFYKQFRSGSLSLLNFYLPKQKKLNIFQVKSILKVEITLENLLKMLSYTFPMLLYFQRYVSFLSAFSLVRSIMQGIQNDCETLKDRTEVAILKKYLDYSKHVVLLFIGMACRGTFFLLTTLLLPTFLHSRYQLLNIQFLGFFYFEQGKDVDWVCVQVTAISTAGLLTSAMTESTLSIGSFYVCGLFETVRYRLESAVNEAVELEMVTRNLLEVEPTVRIHQRALLFIRYLSEGLLMPCLLAILLSILSFAVNLYRMMSSSFSYFTVLYSR
ncbi:uncharacterized protein LOC143174879 isoform X6 [Nomia melanderi]|uniref:uncharacterized protein LOC143174879 isoform X6 n=1 Tax=Nomia melanderi TaxID=2448451 RepID=UPI003FCDC8BA